MSSVAQPYPRATEGDEVDDVKERLRVAMKPHLFASERPPAIRLAELGDLGGAIGAALLSRRVT